MDDRFTLNIQALFMLCIFKIQFACAIEHTVKMSVMFGTGMIGL